MTERSLSDQRAADEVPQQIGVRLDDDLRDALARHTTGHGYAASVRWMIACYDHLCLHERPVLAPNEWRALCDVLNGTILIIDGQHPMLSLALIALELATAQELSGAGPLGFAGSTAAKWSITAERWRQLVAEVVAWRPAQALATISVTVRFWDRCHPDAASAVRVRAAGGDPDAVPGEPGWME